MVQLPRNRKQESMAKTTTITKSQLRQMIREAVLKEQRSLESDLHFSAMNAAEDLVELLGNSSALHHNPEKRAKDLKPLAYNLDWARQSIATISAWLDELESQV